MPHILPYDSDTFWRESDTGLSRLCIGLSRQMRQDSWQLDEISWQLNRYVSGTSELGTPDRIRTGATAFQK